MLTQWSKPPWAQAPLWRSPPNAWRKHGGDVWWKTNCPDFFSEAKASPPHPQTSSEYVSALRSVLRISPASAVSMLSKAEETWASRSPTRSLSNSPGSFFRPPQISHKLGSPALSKSNGAFKGICRWIRDTDAWMKMRIKWGATWCNMSHVFRS